MVRVHSVSWNGLTLLLRGSSLFSPESAPALHPPLCWCKHLHGHMVSLIREQIQTKSKYVLLLLLFHFPVCFAGLFFSWISVRIMFPM